MRIAVQGCTHGCLTQIYDSIAQYESTKNEKVDLLLLCGDFQALRSEHDFESLAVPPKYRALGGFHQYYSGQQTAPVLTIVIGGNHEASNYMWELFHGGWLAPNIYYLGAAGCVRVNGLRIVGASGIYKDHDYNKGYFETVPYNHSTLRSVYHIRKYAIERLKLLPREDGTIVLSHDWPTTIAHHGDKANLLRRKPFFGKEVQDNTLGSPALLDLLKTIQPDYWFSAHLHVKFAAVYGHDTATSASSFPSTTARIAEAVQGQTRNPDEIDIDDHDDFDDLIAKDSAPQQPASINPDEIEIADSFDDEPAEAMEQTATNPDEITLDHLDDFDDITASRDTQEQILYPRKEHGPAKTEITEALEVDESVDLVEQVRKEDENAAQGVIGVSHPVPTSAAGNAVNGDRTTKFLALDKCGPGREFIQYLDIPTPVVQKGDQPRMSFDPHWLAITRALHPYLSLEIASKPFPPRQRLDGLVQNELQRIQQKGVLVPDLQAEGQLVWEKGEVEVGRVQRFWPTAPAHGQPGGSSSAWYTNPQTEAFCGMLGIPNRVNPSPA